MLQTLQGLQDPRNKPDNPNPDIFTRLLQGFYKVDPNTTRACDFLLSG